MSLPQLSHLHFLVIKLIGRGKMSGPDLRGKLTETGEIRSNPAFYQLMERMEQMGWVEKESIRIHEGIYSYQQNLYRVTVSGRTAALGSLVFYSNLGYEEPS